MKRRQGHKRPAPSDRRPEPTEVPEWKPGDEMTVFDFGPEHADYVVQASPKSITCPVCGMTSYNPTDIAEGFCGNCNDWTS